jgi:hypothetical protein
MWQASHYFTQLNITSNFINYPPNADFSTDLEIAQSSHRTHKSSSEFGGTARSLLAALPYRRKEFNHQQKYITTEFKSDQLFINASWPYINKISILILVRNGSYTILIEVDVTARVVCMEKWNESFIE